MKESALLEKDDSDMFAAFTSKLIERYLTVYPTTLLYALSASVVRYYPRRPRRGGTPVVINCLGDRRECRHQRRRRAHNVDQVVCENQHNVVSRQSPMSEHWSNSRVELSSESKFLCRIVCSTTCSIVKLQQHTKHWWKR